MKGAFDILTRTLPIQRAGPRVQRPMRRAAETTENWRTMSLPINQNCQRIRRQQVLTTLPGTPLSSIGFMNLYSAVERKSGASQFRTMDCRSSSGLSSKTGLIGSIDPAEWMRNLSCFVSPHKSLTLSTTTWRPSSVEISAGTATSFGWWDCNSCCLAERETASTWSMKSNDAIFLANARPMPDFPPVTTANDGLLSAIAAVNAALVRKLMVLVFQPVVLPFYGRNGFRNLDCRDLFRESKLELRRTEKNKTGAVKRGGRKNHWPSSSLYTSILVICLEHKTLFNLDDQYTVRKLLTRAF